MKRILLLNIPSTHLASLKIALSQADWEPIVTQDMADLSTFLTKGSFEAMLADLDDPLSPGQEQVEYLREARGILSPLILFSHLPEKELEQRVQTVHAVGYFFPTSNISSLTRLLENVCPEPNEKKLGDRKRIMVVDDSEMTRMIIEAELSDKNFEVLVVDNVAQATRLVLKKETRPDLILLDVRMPNVDGIHFCRFLKSNSLFHGIKVVLCSGLDMDKLQAATRECGADGFVAKDQLLSKWVLREMEEPEQPV